ncbi:MAG: hypothetical protein M1818_007084 [Claussenomyces sp. TS43310]|nr:MAG: hypothetical protein M1818_007084 [Claussenomyces sp. TS43310]
MVVQANLDALHLCRALLRAASYLPDEFARTYIHGHIIYRFRNASQITPARLHDARKSAHTLQRAADGETKPLLRVLYMAYGRTGKRRRELMNRLNASDAGQSSAEVSMAQGPATDLTDHRGRWKETPSRFEQLLRSQVRHQPPGSSRSQIKGLKPNIPKESIWGRPLPLKRQANIKRRFMATTLDRILPPLPEQQFNRLRDLATGVIPFEPPPPRRKPARGSTISEGMMPHPTYLKLPTRVAHRLGDRANVDRHKIRPRFMRRLWGQVWGLSNVMLAPEDKSMKFEIVWGGARSTTARGQFSSPSKSDMELFEGLGGPHQRSHLGRKQGLVNTRRIDRPNHLE